MDTSLNLTPKFVGFFPKKNSYENPWADDGVLDICSVSDCIRQGPDDWIDLWKHNEAGFYDSESIALDIIKKRTDEYTMFAYKLFMFCYENGDLKTDSKLLSRVNNIDTEQDLSGYTFVGFDVVNCMSYYFECSAYSCSAGFKEFNVNEHCLLKDLDSAIDSLKKISEGNYEPGDQYLLEVYRRN